MICQEYLEQGSRVSFENTYCQDAILNNLLNLEYGSFKIDKNIVGCIWKQLYWENEFMSHVFTGRGG